MKRVLFLLLVCIFSLNAAELEKLTSEQVYLNKGDALLRTLPVISGWFDDARFLETRAGKVFLVNARSGRSQVLLDPQALKMKRPANLNFIKPDDHTADYSQLAFLDADDIYLFQKKSGTIRRITATAAAEENPTFSPDGRFLAYTAGGNLFVCDTVAGVPGQLTFDGSEEILNGYASWVYYEEILGRSSRYRAFNWSPDGSRIAFLRFDQSRVPQFPLFDAAGTYGRLEMQRYPKPGFPNPVVKIGVIDLAGRHTDWIAFPAKVDHYLTFLDWTPDGKSFFLQWLNRGQDELHVYEYTLTDKKLRRVYREKQKAWVDFLGSGDFQPLAGGGFLLLSSKSGWNHLYRVYANGMEKMITSGKWSVSRIEFVDEKKRLAFVSADKEDSTRTDLYRVSFIGASPQRLTRLDGTHGVTFSKAGSYFLDRFSSLQQPAILRLCTRDGGVLRRLGESATPALRRVALGKVEMFKIPTADGLQLPAVWYLPPDFNAEKQYPVVLSVYGGPGRRSAKDVFPRRLDDYFLAQQGIIVLKVDHRGSGHFGKQGMAAMHRCLGKWEIADYSSATAYLRGLPFVDGKKIGISGGSYGGYVAALALAAAPDSFACGIADFAVSDWSLYDSVYTEKFMDLPTENPEGYRQASVLTHLPTYRGGLRLTHGSMDDNVHMQNTLLLLNGLLDLGKTAELMVYPGERHGVRGIKATEFRKAALDFWLRKFFPERCAAPGAETVPDKS
ncbi:MAG: DPP IV N-terminal domain-containing protein [Candidatus Aminicenantes bacterium]|nr:DPP IV N-terminal domain-containing protein [Acidobacteriota bacterium]MBU4404244.1 DPP IV N-terminal domain-containing protein [Acidobacteriota bacterium]MCG2812807.1 DPP IV N-terminal domain-containing protein [Candidatus Aminicenantes bacterium]